MMQGFYLLALRQARRRRRIALLFCAAALASVFFAARAGLAPAAAPVIAAAEPVPPYIAVSEGDRLIVTRGGETVLRTAIDTRTLPAADRAALAEGIELPDIASLARLLEDYGS